MPLSTTSAPQAASSVAASGPASDLGGAGRAGRRRSAARTASCGVRAARRRRPRRRAGRPARRAGPDGCRWRPGRPPGTGRGCARRRRGPGCRWSRSSRARRGCGIRARRRFLLGRRRVVLRAGVRARVPGFRRRLGADDGSVVRLSPLFVLAAVGGVSCPPPRGPAPASRPRRFRRPPRGYRASVHRPGAARPRRPQDCPAPPCGAPRPAGGVRFRPALPNLDSLPSRRLARG